MSFKEFLVPLLMFTIAGISMSLIALVLGVNIWFEAISIGLIMGFMISSFIAIAEKM